MTGVISLTSFGVQLVLLAAFALWNYGFYEDPGGWTSLGQALHDIAAFGITVIWFLIFGTAAFIQHHRLRGSATAGGRRARIVAILYGVEAAILAPLSVYVGFIIAAAAS